jgi:hypothetical protein
MKRVLRSATKKIQSKEELSPKQSISNNSKIIKTVDKEDKIDNEDSKKSGIWNIEPIMSNIFTYIEYKDLVEFNTVCKKWNNLTNPIIHKTIKLNRGRGIFGKVLYSTCEKAAKIDSEAVECIINNAKYASFVKKFIYNYSLGSRRAIEVFETFRFICNLTISKCDLSQEQFLGMINPLTQLQELNLEHIIIKKIIGERNYIEAFQLPSSLKKLKLGSIRLINNPDLFIRTINSHSKLVEFRAYMYANIEYLEVFYKPYPSLLNFEFNCELHAPQPLFAVFENNPQLIGLKISLGGWSNELVNYINNTLINLEELKFSEKSNSEIDFFTKFSQPTKIKKLELEWARLSNCSLNSILMNCSHLEELILNRYGTIPRDNYIEFLNLSNPNKLKKLVIDCNNLSEGVLDSLLLNCSQLNELGIALPWVCKEVLKAIYEKCTNLERLEIWPLGFISCPEFYGIEFFTCNPKCKSTLTHLTLNGFKAANSKSEYFKNFENLKSIKYPYQVKKIIRRTASRNERVFLFVIDDIDMNLWQGYKLFSKDNGGSYDIEFKKILN